MSVHWPIIRHLLAAPGRIAVVDDHRRWKGLELLLGSLHVAGAIAPQSESRTVGLLLPTGGLFPMAALAAWSLGRTVVPLNYLLKREELQYVIDDCGCDTVLTVKPMLDFLGYVPERVRIHRLEDLNFKSVPDFRWPALRAPDDLAVLLYTSGTSGKPKGVMLTHANLSSNVDQVRRWIDISSRQVFLGVLPQFHSFGLTALTLLPLSCGCKVVYTARFAPHKIVTLLREHRPSVFVAIPSMYNALLHAKNAKADDWTSVRYVVSGGEPLPPAVFEGFRERFGVTINEGYGLTETSPVTNWCRPDEYRPRSVGRALPGIHERIVDIATGLDLPPGHDGEIRIAGPNVMEGYYHLPDLTAAAFDERGYFRTGDIGRLDDDGHLRITGRLKEMLIVGGENVFPREIEEVLERHPSVKAAGVVGTTDPIRGELPVAFVELKDGAAFDEQALKSFCRDHLAGYKVPRDITRLDALPRNPTGKLMRRELKAML
jgi:long-chain acyl-CoA synthetase